MNPVSHIQNPVRCWTVVISSYTGRLSDQIGIEGEVLTVVPEADLLDAQSTILELEKQVSRYQSALAWEEYFFGGAHTQEIALELSVPGGKKIGPAIIPGIRALKETIADQERRLSEYFQVFSEIDFQAVGKELNLTLGTTVSKSILPGIQALKDEILRKDIQITQLGVQVAALGVEQYEINCRNVYLKSALEKAQVGLEEKDTVIADLRSRIDAAASKLDGALDDLASGESWGPEGQPVGTTSQSRLDAFRALFEATPTPVPPVMEVGGAYKTWEGSIAIVVENDEDDMYPFEVVGDGGGSWSVTPYGSEFYHEGSSGDLVQRIPFPESRLPNPPEGFVYAGYGPLPDASSLGDLALWSPARSLWDSDLCWTGDADDRQYAIRIGSPVHFALASKFAAV